MTFRNTAKKRKCILGVIDISYDTTNYFIPIHN